MTGEVATEGPAAAAEGAAAIEAMTTAGAAVVGIAAAGAAVVDASVIVIAHGRHAHMRRMLTALRDSTPSPRQVVVVAMGDPDIGTLLDEDGGGLPVRVVPLDADVRRLPLARARNVGASVATGQHLVFLDVDCLADPELVGRYVAALEALAAGAEPNTSGPAVCAGPVTYLPPGVPAGAPGAPLDWVDLRAHRAPHAARPDPAPGELLRGTNLDLFWSLSFAVTRADYAACGGFDEAYEGYGGEDTDFARRLGAAGGSLWWVGGADAYHQHHPVSRPPVEHVADIVRNTELFRERWGEDCMTGWLAEFAERGLVEQGADGSWRLTVSGVHKQWRFPHRPRWEKRPGGAAGAVVHLVLGPERHGVTRHALALLPAGGEAPVRLQTSDPAELVATVAALPARAGVHLHLTDGLLPDSARVVTELAARRRVSLTLHDIPTPAEGETRYARRAATYAALTRAASLVVVASAHERGLLADCLAHAAQATPPDQGGRRPLASLEHPALAAVRVVPLPIEPPYRGPRPAPDPVVGILGYIYPGKGHAHAIQAAAAAGLRGVVALGAVAAGHDDLAQELAHAAGTAGLTWEVTGFLPDAELADRARRVAVPLAHHAHVSASGSIGTWIECGRRPLVADGGWARELAQRCPGSVTLLTDLHRAVTAAAEAPELTWLDPSVQVGPSTTLAWGMLADLLAGTHGPGATNGRA